MTTAYPLTWPHWVKRTTYRKTAAFSSYGNALTVSVARQRLQQQVDLLRASNIILSSNVELRLDGVPRSDRREPTDVGVALYFDLKGKAMCMPCDKWDRVADNIAAIAAHIDAIRKIERYGVQSIEEAFTGFVAIEAPSWRRTFGLMGIVTMKDVEEAYRRLAKQYHSDAGGDDEAMISLNTARDQARRELGS